MKFSLAVISDLHCHLTSRTSNESYLLSDMPEAPVNSHPIYSLINLIRDRKLSPDVLLVPGDLANRVDKQGFISAMSYLKEVRRALGNPAMVCTAGNHDIDSHNKYKRGPFEFTKSASKEFPISSEPLNNDFWSQGFCFVELNRCRILVVNSVLHHDNKEEAKRGMMNDVQLERLSKAIGSQQKKTFQIALLHHHPLLHDDPHLKGEDVMHNGDTFIRLLESHGYDLIVHGHKHFPKLRYAPGGTEAPAVFASGSLSAFGKMLSNTRNLFHVIELDGSTVADCVHKGRVISWEFNEGNGWSTPNTQSARFPSAAGFGYRGSIKNLVDKTYDFMKKSKTKRVSWSNVTRALPQLNFVLPDDLRSYSMTLQTTHKIFARPAPPDVPEEIGFAVNGI